MKNFVFKLLIIAFMSAAISVAYDIPVLFVGLALVAGGLLIGKTEKGALLDVIAPELLTELEAMRTKMTETLNKSAKAEIAEQIKALESKIKAGQDANDAIIDIKVKADERDKRTQKELDEMSAELKQFKDRLTTNDQAKAVTREQAILKGLNGKGASIDDNTGKIIALESTDIAETLKAMKGNKHIQGVTMVVKANTDPITEYTSYSGGTVGLSAWDPEYARVVRRMPYIRQIVRSKPTSKGYIAWAEQSGVEGSAGGTAEAASKNQGTFDTVEANMQLRKRTYFIKTSKENLDDLPFMANEINTEIFEVISIDLDNQILQGDNTSQNLKGILEYAPTLSVSGTDLANGVAKAQNWDVLRVAAAQIAVNGAGRFMPNYGIMHPWDVAAMDLSKATDGVYVIPPFISDSGRRVAGMIIIENTGIDEGTFLVGDFNKSNLAIRNDIQISIGYDGNDFTKNLVTILGEVRAAHYIKTNHINAFVQGTFSTAKALLDPTVVS